MNAIKGYRKPRGVNSFTKAFQFWLMDSFDCGLNAEGPDRTGAMEFNLDFDHGRRVYVVAAADEREALATMLAPDEFKAVMKMREARAK